MDVGLVPGLVIGLREGIEAALVIGIVLAYLTKVGQKALRRYVFLGVLLAVVASLGIAAAFAVVWGTFEGQGEQLFEGFAAILAVVVLTALILWMMRASKDLRKHVEQRIDVLVDRRQVLGLASLAFLAVFREGVETVLFVAGLTGSATTADILAGVAIGILVAGFLGFGIFAASWKVNLRRFFRVSSVLLVVIAAGLFALGVHELQEAGVLPWLSGEVYSLKAVFPDGASNPAGYLLRGLLGYNDNPTQIEVVAYAAYWLFTAAASWGIRTGKIAVVTNPLRRLWASLTGRVPVAEPEAD